MVDKYLRASKDVVLLSAAQYFRNIHPIYITLLAFCLGLIAVVSIVLTSYSWALFFWLANRFFDGLDGSIARLWGKQSDLGGYIDILLDFIIYALIPLSLVLANPSQIAYFSLAILFASFYVNAGSWLFLAALLEKRDRSTYKHKHMENIKTSIVMPSGFIEGAETILLYCFLLIFPQKMILILTIMTFLVLLTVIQRVVWAIRNL